MGIFDWLQEKIIKKYAGSLIRHGITTLAGVLAAASFPGALELSRILTENADPLSGAMTAAVVFLIGLLLSFKNAKK